MKMKPSITVADNGNLQIHIPMLIRRMRGRKTVIAPQALDGDIPGAQEPVQSAILQALEEPFPGPTSSNPARSSPSASLPVPLTSMARMWPASSN